MRQRVYWAKQMWTWSLYKLHETVLLFTWGYLVDAFSTRLT